VFILNELASTWIRTKEGTPQRVGTVAKQLAVSREGLVSMESDANPYYGQGKDKEFLRKGAEENIWS
jgi:hypothetical protein